MSIYDCLKYCLQVHIAGGACLNYTAASVSIAQLQSRFPGQGMAYMPLLHRAMPERSTFLIEQCVSTCWQGDSMQVCTGSADHTLWPYRFSRGAASAKALTAISTAPCSNAVCSRLGRSNTACSLKRSPRTCTTVNSSWHSIDTWLCAACMDCVLRKTQQFLKQPPSTL